MSLNHKRVKPFFFNLFWSWLLILSNPLTTQVCPYSSGKCKVKLPWDPTSCPWGCLLQTAESKLRSGGGELEPACPVSSNVNGAKQWDKSTKLKKRDYHTTQKCHFWVLYQQAWNQSPGNRSVCTFIAELVRKLKCGSKLSVHGLMPGWPKCGMYTWRNIIKFCHFKEILIYGTTWWHMTLCSVKWAKTENSYCIISHIGNDSE